MKVVNYYKMMRLLFEEGGKAKRVDIDTHYIAHGKTHLGAINIETGQQSFYTPMRTDAEVNWIWVSEEEDFPPKPVEPYMIVCNDHWFSLHQDKLDIMLNKVLLPWQLSEQGTWWRANLFGETVYSASAENKARHDELLGKNHILLDGTEHIEIKLSGAKQDSPRGDAEPDLRTELNLARYLLGLVPMHRAPSSHLQHKIKQFLRDL